jgi:hypothetical protein
MNASSFDERALDVRDKIVQKRGKPKS